jgi:hypothetical protein
MIPCGIFLEENSDQLNKPLGTDSETWKLQVWQKLNESYRFVADSFPWLSLQNTVTLTDSVYIVPSDCRIILTVKDSNKQPYNFIGGKNRQSKFNYNWHFDNSISTPLAEGTTLSVSEYATAVASTAEFPATTCANEYIRVGANVGIYKISTWTSTSAITLFDRFRGNQLSDSRFQIRPRGTQVLAFSDAYGTAITPTGIEITYARQPLPLYSEEDLIELPGSCPAVSVKMLQKLLALSGFNQAADRKQGDYIEAMSVMKSSEPEEEIAQPSGFFQDRNNSKGIGYIRGLSQLNSGNW